MDFGGNNNNNDRQGGGGGAIEDWYRSIPPVTKWFVTGCVLTSLLVQLDVLSPRDLWLNYVAVWEDCQLWRLVTNFLFFGHFDLNFVFHLFFLVRHSRNLEDTTYHGRTADYLFLWLFASIVLLIVSFLFAHFRVTKIIPFFLAPSLTSVVVYVWSKHNPHLRMTFLYLFTFSAPWLPWVILSLSWILGQDPMDDLLGIGIGHLYYFLDVVYPSETGRHLLKTPRILKLLLDQPEPQQRPAEAH